MYRRHLSSILIYAAVIAAAFFVADSRTHRQQAASEPAQPTETTPVPTAPFFSLSTTRTFGTSENPRLWLDHRNIDSLDFRVYRINDPQRFFTQLSDPHQLGEDEREQVATNISARRSLLERVRAVKVWAYSGIRNYFREQLKQNTRKTFNQRFRNTESTKRVPLNVADYPRVPLLNSNQLVTSWREQLPHLDNQYDQRSIPLGKRESGVYLVEAIGGELRAYTIVVVTDLAMVEKLSANGDLLVYAVDRKSGEPRADTRVDIVRERATIASGRTNSDGIFHTKIPTQEQETDPTGEEANNSNFVILAANQENFAISDLESFYFSNFGEETEKVQGYIYTDRPVYRPNHKVFFKGILRGFDEHRQYRAIKGDKVNVTVKDSNDARVFQQELQLSKRGTFNGEFTLAEEAPLGIYHIEAATEDGESSGPFEVAEYKKPEYKVSVSTPQKFAPAGSKSKFNIDARYFFGAPVSGAEVQYYIYRSRYYPYFNDSEEPVEDSDEDAEYSQYDNYYTDLVHEGEGKLDSSGRLQIDFDVPASNENDVWDFQYRLEAQVTDSSRRSINGSASLIATRGSVIAHATSDRYVYTKDQTATITVSTTDYEARPVPAKVSLKFVSRNWIKVEHKENEYDPDYKVQENELSSADVTTDREGHAEYKLPITSSGNIAIKTVVHDAGKQLVSVGGFIWVASPDDKWASSEYYSENAGSIKLVPDKKSYRPGDTAHVLAILPKERANLLVTTELGSVMFTRHLNVPGKTTIIDVPIEKYYAPNVFLNATFVRDGDMYTSDQRLVVPARDKMLNLEVISNKEEYKPRETASYTILARDADGAPVPDAEVSLGVVDEAIYSISPDFSGNIRQQFYGMLYNEVETHLSVSFSFRGFAGDKPVDLASTKSSYQLADFKNESEPVQPTIRKNFQDTAFWEANAITGNDGRATVKFRLPDNLTTWRATARGVTADTKVGVARQKVISRKDVIMRLEMPRFLTEGDTVTLSGIVHNYLKQDKSTQISIAVTGARLLSPAQQTVTIPKQGEHRLDWQISAPQTGEIRLLAKALTNTESDAVELALGVIPRGLHETKAQNWTTTDENVEQEFSLNLPADTDLNSRQLRLDVSPSIAGTLFGALDYLTSYPYGCTEQTMSSFLPNVIVANALQEVQTANISEKNNLNKKVRTGLKRLYNFQHDDGGWGWWKDDPTDPWMTAYVVDGLTMASRAGYQIDDSRVEKGRGKLGGLVESGKNDDGKPIDTETRAYMVYALSMSGGVDPRHVDDMFTNRGRLQAYGRALLALTLKQRGDRRAQQVASEIEGSARATDFDAHWESKRQPALDFSEDDSLEATALSIKALAQINPQSELLPKGALWLVANRKYGSYWVSTKQTAFAIYGLTDYLKSSQELTPNYALEVYVNNEQVLTKQITSADVGDTQLVIKRKDDEVAGNNQIRVVKHGPGALYLSTTLNFATTDEQQPTQGGGMKITREYLRLFVDDNNGDPVWRAAPLTGDLHSGDMIISKLHVEGPHASYVMIEDPIPAGCEQIEQVSGIDFNYSTKDWSDWYSAREFRDNRTALFLNYFDGDSTFRYALRVQEPGDFRVAPARVELMYVPTVQANTASGSLKILDRQ